MIKIALVEDNKVVRDGLTQLLSAQTDMQVVAQAASASEALLLLKNNLKVDIVLSDLKMPQTDGIQMTEQLLKIDPDLKVIILTMESKNGYAERALQKGVKGFITKYGDMNELYVAIRAVHAGKTFI